MHFLIVFLAKYFYLVVAAIFVFYFLSLSALVKKRFFLLSLFSLPLSYLIAKILGHFFYNPRPFVSEHVAPLIRHAANNGFPSDHALLTMSLAAIVFMFQRRLGVLLMVFAFLIGFARVLAKIHHTVDILGSFAIAVLAVYLVNVFLKKYFHKSDQP